MPVSVGGTAVPLHNFLRGKEKDAFCSNTLVDQVLPTRRRALVAVLVVEHKKETTSFCLFKHATRGPLVKTAGTKTCKKGHLNSGSLICSVLKP